MTFFIFIVRIAVFLTGKWRLRSQGMPGYNEGMRGHKKNKSHYLPLVIRLIVIIIPWTCTKKLAKMLAEKERRIYLYILSLKERVIFSLSIWDLARNLSYSKSDCLSLKSDLLYWQTWIPCKLSQFCVPVLLPALSSFDNTNILRIPWENKDKNRLLWKKAREYPRLNWLV